MTVAVVIPFHHRLQLLEKALASVQGLPCYVVNDGLLDIKKNQIFS